MKKPIMYIIVVLIIFAILPYNVVAWNNADAHMEINKFAYELFESDIMSKDLSFEYPSSCTKDDIECIGKCSCDLTQR